MNDFEKILSLQKAVPEEVQPPTHDVAYEEYKEAVTDFVFTHLRESDHDDALQYVDAVIKVLYDNHQSKGGAASPTTQKTVHGILEQVRAEAGPKTDERAA